MSIIAEKFTAASFLRRSESLLESASRLMRVDLELWVDPSARFPVRTLPGCCLRCSRNTAALFHECQESCAHGVRMTVHPIPGRDRTAGVLFCADPRRANGARGQADRSEAARSPEPAGRPARHESLFLESLLRILSDQLFLGHEVSILTGELSARYDELQMLYSIAGRLSQQEDLRLTLRRILEHARGAVEADAALLSIHHRKLREAVVREGIEGLSGTERQLWSRVAEALSHLTRRAGGRFYLGNPWDSPDDSSPLPQSAQALSVGVKRRGNDGGILALLHFDPSRSFRSNDIRLLESVSEQVSLAIANTELYEDLKDFLMATVKSLVGAIEAKDAYTSGHSERVNLLSLLIGRKLGLDEPEMETLRWASILHDVGKIGMPERILGKPGKLTAAEFEIIKQHPDRGYRLLSPIRQLADAALIVRAHHEMVDGNGYPERLQGDAIPQLARIIAVADTYDALTTNRPYRAARSLDEALGEIRRVRGGQLDGGMVDAFFELVPFLREHSIMLRDGDELEAEAA
jgi:hypothetical protein